MLPIFAGDLLSLQRKRKYLTLFFPSLLNNPKVILSRISSKE
jgi:hypothetical protein